MAATTSCRVRLAQPQQLPAKLTSLLHVELQNKFKHRAEGVTAASTGTPAPPTTNRDPVDATVFRRLDAPTPSTSTASHGNGAAASGAADEEVKKVKRALLTLQAQTKAAVEGMLARIDHQQKERLALVSALRDMKATMTQQQELTKKLEQQTLYVYQTLQKVQQDVAALQAKK